MKYYRIYVRLKRGGQATGREVHNGSPPGSRRLFRLLPKFLIWLDSEMAAAMAARIVMSTWQCRVEGSAPILGLIGIKVVAR